MAILPSSPTLSHRSQTHLLVLGARGGGLLRGYRTGLGGADGLHLHQRTDLGRAVDPIVGSAGLVCGRSEFWGVAGGASLRADRGPCAGAAAAAPEGGTGGASGGVLSAAGLSAAAVLAGQGRSTAGQTQLEKLVALDWQSAVSRIGDLQSVHCTCSLGDRQLPTRRSLGSTRRWRVGFGGSPKPCAALFSPDAEPLPVKGRGNGCRRTAYPGWRCACPGVMHRRPVGAATGMLDARRCLCRRV